MLNLVKNSEQYWEISLVGEFPNYHPLAELGLLTPGSLFGIITTSESLAGSILAQFDATSFTVVDGSNFIWRILYDEIDYSAVVDERAPVYARVDHVSLDGSLRFQVYSTSVFVYQSYPPITTPQPQTLETAALTLSLSLPETSFGQPDIPEGQIILTTPITLNIVTPSVNLAVAQSLQTTPIQLNLTYPAASLSIAQRLETSPLQLNVAYPGASLTEASPAITLATLPADGTPVLIASGQSNQGTFTDGSLQNTGPQEDLTITSPVLSDVFVYDNVADNFVPLFDSAVNIDGYAMAPVIEAFRAEFPTKPVYIIWFSIGGTGFQNGTGSWALGGVVRTTLLDNYVIPALTRLLAQGIKPYPAFWFHQSERDASAPSSFPDWAFSWGEQFSIPSPNYYSLLEELRQVMPGIGAIVMQLSNNAGDLYKDQIRLEQSAVAAADSNIELVDTTPAVFQSDGIHFNATGFATMAPNVYAAWKLLTLTEVTAVGTRSNPLSFGNSASPAAGVLDAYPDPLLALSVRKLKATSPMPAISKDRAVTDFDNEGVLPVGTSVARIESIPGNIYRTVDANGWVVQNINGRPGLHFNYVESLPNPTRAWEVVTDTLNSTETDFLAMLLATWAPLAGTGNLFHAFGNDGPYPIVEFGGLDISGCRIRVRGANENNNGFATLDSSTRRLGTSDPPIWRLITVQRSGLSFTCHANGSPIGNTYTAASAFQAIGDVAFRPETDMIDDIQIGFAALWVGANVPSDPRALETHLTTTFDVTLE